MGWVGPPVVVRFPAASELRACYVQTEWMNVSRRTERVASVIRTVLAETIQNRLSDPRIEPLTSITHVEVSADFSVANVYVSVMAPAARQKLSVEALRHARGRLRGAVARQLTLRRVPELVFHLDESIQRAFETVQQIDRLMEEIEGPEPTGVEAGEDWTTTEGDGHTSAPSNESNG